MHTLSITYEDYLDQKVTETLHFNITTTELAEHMDLRDRMEEIQRTIVDGPKREISSIEVRTILELVKDIMKLSYGIRSENGRNFRKSDEIWDDFATSMAYDAVIRKMFNDTNLVYHFFTEIMPKTLREQAQQKLKDEHPELVPSETVQEQNAAVIDRVAEDISKTETASEDTRPAYIREDRDPTNEELQRMSRAELQEAFSRKAQS